MPISSLNPASNYIYTELRVQNPSPVGHLSEINSQDEEYLQDYDIEMLMGMDHGMTEYDYRDQEMDRLAVVPARNAGPSSVDDSMSVNSGHGKSSKVSSRKGRSGPSDVAASV